MLASGSQTPGSLVHAPLLPLFWAQVIVAVEETVRVIDANEALPTSVFEGPILRWGDAPLSLYHCAEDCD